MPLRPSRPLPRKFNRRVSGATKAFVERRHKRVTHRRRQVFSRHWRRVQGGLVAVALFIRRWTLVVIVAVLLIIFGVLLFSPIVRVRTIRVQRTESRVDPMKIQEALAPVLGQHLVFLSSRDIVAMARAAVPDAQEVTVTKQYPSILLVRITLRPIVARLLIKAPTASPDTAPVPAEVREDAAPEEALPLQDFLTDNGMYVTAPPMESGATLPLLTIVDWTARPIPSTPLLSEEFLKHMSGTETILRQEFGQDVMGRTVFLRAREYHLTVGKLSLWFDLKSSVADHMNRYRIFLRSGEKDAAKEYIDLRLTGKVVYR